VGHARLHAKACSSDGEYTGSKIIQPAQHWTTLGARSYHPGSVNNMTWWTLATRSDGEVISAGSFQAPDAPDRRVGLDFPARRPLNR
jgi:hypothetical protein